MRLFDGRALTAADIGHAEVLLVRSVTRVDAGLLGGSRVRFVGTATAGADHVDQAWLREVGIHFADATGCNARAVAEHVACCLYAHAATRGVPVSALEVGIVGYGNVGRALARLLDGIGVRCVANDPPLGGDLPGVTSATLDEVLERDVVSLHVPLVAGGAWPTLKLIDAARLARLRPGALLINAARGGVVDERALAARLADGDALQVALDCWAGEPAIDAGLVRRAWQASPHIAGHSREARANASALLHAALARHLDVSAVLPALLPPNPEVLGGSGQGVTEILGAVHPLAAHTARMRDLAGLDEAARGAEFDAIRRRHGLRREFASYTVAPAGLAADTVAELAALGFTVPAAA